MTKVQPPLIGDKTIEEWDAKWVKVDGGLQVYQPQLRHHAGLYRVSHGRRIVALGTGTDKKGGLAKRLSDFHRPSPSGRNHHAGRLIYEHRNDLVVEVLITGSDPDARKFGRQLKRPMILLHRPNASPLGRR